MHAAFAGQATSPTTSREGVLNRNQRRETLQHFGAHGACLDELLAYNQPPQWPDTDLNTPLAEEPCVATWRDWRAQADTRPVIDVLTDHLPQLNFPIQAGISQTAAYTRATRQGAAWRDMPEASGITWADPAGFELALEATIAGPIAVITIRDRGDFCTFIRALLKRNEPLPVPDAMGATMIAGYNNWTRFHAWQRAWQRDNPDGYFPLQGLPVLKARKDQFQDRFIVLSRAPYSNVAHTCLGEPDVDAAAWLQRSDTIRAQHEMTHYAVLRRLGYMRNNMHDELVADYMGICAAAGRFRADWFYHFVGLEDFPSYRDGARLENYATELSPPAFNVLAALMHAAAAHLAAVDQAALPAWDGPLGRAPMIYALASLSLEALAAPHGRDLLADQLHLWQTRLAPIA